MIERPPARARNVPAVVSLLVLLLSVGGGSGSCGGIQRGFAPVTVTLHARRGGRPGRRRPGERPRAAGAGRAHGVAAPGEAVRRHHQRQLERGSDEQRVRAGAGGQARRAAGPDVPVEVRARDRADGVRDRPAGGPRGRARPATGRDARAAGQGGEDRRDARGEGRVRRSAAVDRRGDRRGPEAVAGLRRRQGRRRLAAERNLVAGVQKIGDAALAKVRQQYAEQLAAIKTTFTPEQLQAYRDGKTLPPLTPPPVAVKPRAARETPDPAAREAPGSRAGVGSNARPAARQAAGRRRRASGETTHPAPCRRLPHAATGPSARGRLQASPADRDAKAARTRTGCDSAVAAETRSSRDHPPDAGRPRELAAQGTRPPKERRPPPRSSKTPSRRPGRGEPPVTRAGAWNNSARSRVASRPRRPSW